MTTFPLDAHLPGEWYTGYDMPRFQRTHPAPAEAFAMFEKADEARFWMIEGHWSRGFTPLTLSAASDALSGTQVGANRYQLPTSKGLAGRMDGVHAYVSQVVCCSDWEVAMRAMDVEALVGPAIMNFPAIWAARVTRLKAMLAHLEGVEMGSLDLAGVHTYLQEASVFHKWAWEVHFEIMNPLIGNYLDFKGVCASVGLDDSQVSRFLQGYDTKILETDRELWKLCAAARNTRVAEIIAAHAPAAALAALTAEGAATAEWLGLLRAFLNEYGWRTDGMCDPTLAPWVEDPTPVFAKLRPFLQTASDHDFVAANGAAVAERDEAIAAARAGLSGDALAAFEGALGAVQHANFAWWQEEHNFYIDLRAHIPIRRAALRIGELVGVDRFDDCAFLFGDELLAVAAGTTDYETLRPLISPRREFYVRDKARRSSLPPVLGTIPEGEADPVLVEVYGLDTTMLESVGAITADSTSFTGVPASSGTAVGRARVLLDADGLIDLEPDEILVCVFTAPDWTPAFALVSGCVADSGGMLSHTAVVSREYRVPCVCGAGVATSLIRTGDLVEVNGTTGEVRILERA